MRGIGIGLAVGGILGGVAAWFIQQARLNAAVNEAAKFTCASPTAACPMFGFPFPGYPGGLP